MITVLLADDHQIVRTGLKTLLDMNPDIRVVAEASDGRTAVEYVEKYDPAVVIMDIGMPDLNGIEATRQIMKSSPDVRIIALSMHIEKCIVLDMLRAGALGYLPKGCAYEELMTAIETVMKRQPYLSPRIADIVLKDYLNHVPATEASAYGMLSSREREVLQLIAEGKTSKEMAVIMHLSQKTIETYRQAIMDKLDLHSVAELTKYAIREGITPLDIL